MVGIKYLLCMDVWQCSSETQNVVRQYVLMKKKKHRTYWKVLTKFFVNIERFLCLHGDTMAALGMKHLG